MVRAAVAGMRIYRAPWDRWFRTNCLRGAVAYEVQVGPVVLMWFYEACGCHPSGKRAHVWRDPYWRNSRRI